ncbi:MAG: hypothetical protein R3D68_12415 [Hyphomicrobiaceae bacterium]
MAGAARGIAAASIVIAGLLVILSLPARAENAAAHALAGKFAAEADRGERHKREKEKARIEALRKQQETDMLARARAEADARRIALEEARRAQEAAAEAARRAAEAEQRAMNERRLAAERAAAEAERVAHEKRRQEEAARLAEAARRAEAERQRAAALAAEKARAEAERQRIAEEAAAQERQHRELVAQREAETHRLTAALREARERRARHEASSRAPTAALPGADHGRQPRIATQAAPTVPAAPARDEAQFRERAALGGPAPVAEDAVAAANAETMTVLIVMQPGNRGIRRHNKTADPLICGAGGCYVSNGPDAEATFMPGHRALGLRRTLSGRAGACKNTLGCIFRGVDLAMLHHFVQPVDMRLVRHDRREGHFIETDSRCGMQGPRLACAAPVRGADYVMWLVPEALAARVGAAVLEQALWDGLGEGAATGTVSFRN